MCLDSERSRPPLDAWPSIHPAWLTVDQLLRECEVTQTRRGGPGGQHRNKVSTAIVITHRPSGITAEASERRTQSDNRRVAIQRLREQLAIVVRTSTAIHLSELNYIEHLRRQYGGGQLRVAEGNPDRPAVLAILLDDLRSVQNQVSAVAPRWNTSTSQLIRFLKQIPDAFTIVNVWRTTAGQKPLK